MQKQQSKTEAIKTDREADGNIHLIHVAKTGVVFSVPSAIKSIDNLCDVSSFCVGVQINALGMGFHPDNRFDEYIFAEDVTVFNAIDAEHLNDLMDQCFKVCNDMDIDIYEFCMDILKAMNWIID